MIYFIDRKTQKKEKEKVYGEWAIKLLYGDAYLAKPFRFWLLPLIAKMPFFSYLYGFLQKSRFSKRKIKPFIKQYQIDESEFLHKTETFRSFNDFFIRKLQKKARPVAQSDAVLFADARYLFYPNLKEVDGFWVKGKKFDLKDFLQDETLAKRYERGAMVLARLCPTDYHRFHFPFEGTPKKSRFIDGFLYSVNPQALKKNIKILSENKRVMIEIASKDFGTVQYCPIGATYVGSIHETFSLKKTYEKGDEMGYFSFGGSSIILLFEEGKIEFDEDLLAHQGIEIYGKMGESMGRALGK